MSANLYTNIDQTVPNKLHGPMHCKIGETCVYNWTRVLYSVVITRQSNPLISQFNSLGNEFTSFWSMFIYNNNNSIDDLVPQKLPNCLTIRP